MAAVWSRTAMPTPTPAAANSTATATTAATPMATSPTAAVEAMPSRCKSTTPNDSDTSSTSTAVTAATNDTAATLTATSRRRCGTTSRVDATVPCRNSPADAKAPSSNSATARNMPGPRTTCSSASGSMASRSPSGMKKAGPNDTAAYNTDATGKASSVLTDKSLRSSDFTTDISCSSRNR